MATTVFDPRSFQEIDEVLQGALWGVPMSDLSRIERCYELTYKKQLDYNSFGVADIRELVFNMVKHNKAFVLSNPGSKETYVMSASLAKSKQNDYLKFIIEELLSKYGGEIAFTSFEDFYKDKYKLEWNSLEFGLTNLDELCDVFKDIVKVEVNSSGEKVMKAGNKGSSRQARQAAITREIEEVFESYPFGIAMSDLSCIEWIYQIKFDKSLDYETFGVATIEELFAELRKQKKVLFSNRTESKELHVMSAPLIEAIQQGFLESIVLTILDEYDGEIELNSFEDFYKDNCKQECDSYNFGLTNLDELCDVFKDIASVEVNSSGEKVMKFRGDEVGKWVAPLYYLRKEEK